MKIIISKKYWDSVGRYFRKTRFPKLRSEESSCGKLREKWKFFPIRYRNILIKYNCLFEQATLCLFLLRSQVHIVWYVYLLILVFNLKFVNLDEKEKRISIQKVLFVIFGFYFENLFWLLFESIFVFLLLIFVQYCLLS